MRLKIALLMLTLMLPAGVAFPQATKQAKQTNKIKTVRVHIDGFQKSKSGAI